MNSNANKKSGKSTLTPLETEMRNLVVVSLSTYGLTNKSISLIMNLDESMVCRIIKREELPTIT